MMRMGNQKHKWKQVEEEALKAGVKKYGIGKWKNILMDSQFSPCLSTRSNIDLKDKWRNMAIYTAGQAGKQSRRSRARPLAAGRLPENEAAALCVPMVDDDADCKSHQDAKYGRTNVCYSVNSKEIGRCFTTILEAIVSLKNPNGSDLDDIIGFIKQRHEVPQNFRRLLSSRLKKLVLQGKVEKVHNYCKIKDCFKIKDSNPGTKAPTLKMKDIRPSLEHVSTETVEEAARPAAYQIAEAEFAAGAAKEAERVTKMAEESPGTKAPTLERKGVRPSLEHASDETVEQAARAAAYQIDEAEYKTFLAAEAAKEAKRVTKMAEESPGMKAPTLKRKEVRPSLEHGSTRTVEEAARAAAYHIAEAEYKVFLVAEAAKEAERVTKMAEESEALLLLAKELHECCSRGELVLLL